MLLPVHPRALGHLARRPGGMARVTSLSLGDRMSLASGGSWDAIAAIRRSVAATGSLAASEATSIGSPTRIRTVGGFATAVTAGTRAARGQTASVPHSPMGTTGAPVIAASRAQPVLP